MYIVLSVNNYSRLQLIVSTNSVNRLIKTTIDRTFATFTFKQICCVKNNNVNSKIKIVVIHRQYI